MKGNPSTNMAGLVVLCTENYFQLYHGTIYSLGKKKFISKQKNPKNYFRLYHYQSHHSSSRIPVFTNLALYSHQVFNQPLFTFLCCLSLFSSSFDTSTSFNYGIWLIEGNWGIGRMKSLPLIKGRRVDTRKYGYSRNDRAKHCPTKDRPETR